MIVEDQLDRSMGRIGGVDELEEFNKFAAAVAVLDEGVDLAGEQIDAGQQADRSVALVLVVAREGRMSAGLGRQVRGCRGDCLNAGLLIVVTIATASLGSCFAAAAVSLMSFTSR